MSQTLIIGAVASTPEVLVKEAPVQQCEDFPERPELEETSLVPAVAESGGIESTQATLQQEIAKLLIRGNVERIAAFFASMVTDAVATRQRLAELGKAQEITHEIAVEAREVAQEVKEEVHVLTERVDVHEERLDDHERRITGLEDAVFGKKRILENKKHGRLSYKPNCNPNKFSEELPPYFFSQLRFGDGLIAVNHIKDESVQHGFGWDHHHISTGDIVKIRESDGYWGGRVFEDEGYFFVVGKMAPPMNNGFRIIRMEQEGVENGIYKLSPTGYFMTVPRIGGVFRRFNPKDGLQGRPTLEEIIQNIATGTQNLSTDIQIIRPFKQGKGIVSNAHNKDSLKNEMAEIW